MEKHESLKKKKIFAFYTSHFLKHRWASSSRLAEIITLSSFRELESSLSRYFHSTITVTVYLPCRMWLKYSDFSFPYHQSF